ncbi:periphilin-1-like [Phodopus roborovskii]|uniref:periphilin-1-like n=1 Tax=Phodopus roborovskii TaxID=109678 RepID=UPI0021E4FCC2|nr:periphilin-1-like [Phodopus roborovskii]
MRPPLRDTRPPVRDTRPPVRDTRSPVLDTRPSVRDTRAPVRDMRPPVRDMRPSVRDTRAPVRDTRPPVRDMRRPVRDTRPPVRERTPPVRDRTPPVRNKRPPVRDMTPPVLARADGEGYSRYYSHVDYQECDKGRSFSHDRRSGPPQRGDDFTSQWSEYRHKRDAFGRESFCSSHYSRERSPHKRDAPFFRESPVGQKDSPHSRSGSRLSSRSSCSERSRTHSSHQSQSGSKERCIQSLKTSRDNSPSSSSVVYSSEMLDKPSRLTERELAKATSKSANEKPEKAEESNLIEISEFEGGSMAPLFIDQTEEPESNTPDGTELYEDSQLSRRSKAIASKTKEIEEVYRQDHETFGMVVNMLIEKDPSLEKSIQFALRQTLHEMSKQCVEELNQFITEYDNATQDFGDHF